MPDKKDGTPQIQRGGRPAGAATRLSRKLANEICASGRSPLDIMTENMLYWHDQAVALREKLEELLSDERNPDRMTKAATVFGELVMARDIMQRCALEAAPYVHPKLQAIATQALQTPNVIKVETIIPRNGSGENRSYRDKADFLISGKTE